MLLLPYPFNTIVAGMINRHLKKKKLNKQTTAQTISKDTSVISTSSNTTDGETSVSEPKNVWEYYFDTYCCDDDFDSFYALFLPIDIAETKEELGGRIPLTFSEYHKQFYILYKEIIQKGTLLNEGRDELEDKCDTLSREFSSKYAPVKTKI